MNYQTIGELVRKLEQDDKVSTTTIGKYVDFNQRENLEKIDAYINSKFTSGDTDSRGREKPFFNIVTAAINIWYRATDIDRKHIRIKANKLVNYVFAFLATVKMQEWMKKIGFGRFLNDWGITLARYGSAILKFVEKGGELHCEVMPWNRMIVDPVDFDNNPKVEKLWFTPAELLKKKEYDQDYVRKLLNAVEVRETPEGQDKDTKSEYIPVYEVHGEMPLAYLTGKEEDEEEYVQQMHVISYVEKRDEGEGEWEDYTLVKGKEKKSPYMITHLIREDGRTQSIGAVEHLFQAQWMMNHTAKIIKDHLDLASKMIFQTSDGSFVGQNALESIEQGDILNHKLNEPLTQLNNRADIAAMQSYAAQWKRQGDEIVGTPEGMKGEPAKSGTAWRQTEALLYESHSLFEMMMENKGLDLERMMREYIIPFIKTKMDTSEEISAILDDHQITQLDAMYVPNEAIRRVNQKIKNAVLSGKMFTREQRDEELQIETGRIEDMLAQLGNQRFIKPSDVSDETWKDMFKDLEWEVEVDVTGESVDRQAILTTLNTVFQTIGSNPMILDDPRMKLIFNKIISEVGGISPIELDSVAPRRSQQQVQQGQPQAPQVPIGQQGAGMRPAPTG